ncbi:MAG: DNA polymerase/3'-5' exonuclease PolX [Bacillota bacterium]
MKNFDVAYALEEIAALLEILGEDAFRVNAYRKAARGVEGYPGDVEDLARRDALSLIPGVGPALSAKIRELLDTGSIRYLEELRKKVPPGVLGFLAIPGIGGKTASMLFNELHLESLEELENAARAGLLRGLRGFGEKKEAAILRGIEAFKKNASRILLADVFALAHDLRDALLAHAAVQRAELAGSFRRRRETVKDLDLVVASDHPDAVMDYFAGLPLIAEVTSRGDTKLSGTSRAGIGVDLRVVKHSEFAAALLHLTGSAEHNASLRGLAKDLGLKINEYGVWSEDGLLLRTDEEADLYSLLGLSFIPPELRENRGEIEAAARAEIPELISLDCIRGDLHIHTRYSDGLGTIEEVAEQAARWGYEYLAITDHSRSLVIAHGLDAARLKAQGERIRRLNDEMGAVRLLHGVEVDILPDGSLDHPDEVLAGLDVVVASVHSAFRQDRQTMTRRIIRAMENPHVDIVAHPTGRLIGRRDAYEVDIEEVIRAAKRTNTVLEINASPDRLDLSDVHARMAASFGVKIAINSDGHSVAAMHDMQFGVFNARRAWLTEEHVINTMPFERLQDFLANHKK